MHAGSKQSTPYMRVSFNGKTHKVPVKPGEAGQKEFAAAIRKLLNLPEEQEFDVSFALGPAEHFSLAVGRPGTAARELGLISVGLAVAAGHFPLPRARLR